MMPSPGAMFTDRNGDHWVVTHVSYEHTPGHLHRLRNRAGFEVGTAQEDDNLEVEVRIKRFRGIRPDLPALPGGPPMLEGGAIALPAPTHADQLSLDYNDA